MNESNDDEYIIGNCIVSNATKYKVLKLNFLHALLISIK